jgi:alpha-D-ribose 1-methylphosphonate 5-triphosphate synthase subunit PhnH
LKLDLVHDLQKTFRTLLDCTARPGTVGSTARELELLDIDVPFNKTLLLLGLTLLDAETNFRVVEHPETGGGRVISQLTYARQSPAAEAAFIFLPRTDADADAPVLAETLTRAQRGTLIDPQLGATVIVETTGILDPDAPDAARWSLSGPGIEHTAALALDNRDLPRLRRVFAARAEACVEFPLGIDLILVDNAGRIVCLPRTTLMGES